jgi:amino acid adenylation domain-containing protein
VDGQSIRDCFAERVRQHAGEPAVSDGSTQLTFAELDAASDACSVAVLDRRGPGAGRVALLMGHDAAACVAALGVVKAGKTVVALNPADPAPRLEHVRHDADPELVIVDRRHRDVAHAAGFTPADMLTLPEPNGSAADERNAHPDDLANLVYTSGSTGRPKGVMLTHRTVLHHALCQGNALMVEPGDRVALLAPLSSSWGMATLWMSVLRGATACLFPLAERGVTELAIWIPEAEITRLALSTSVFRNIVGTLHGRLSRVGLIQLGAEVTRRADFEAFRLYFPETATMLNTLGSSEGGCLTAYRLTAASQPPAGVLPVGRACEGFEVLVLDESGREVPAGEAGEIVVRSDYLSPGYWRDAELTAERFAVDPGGHGRLFYTRDLGRMSDDGLLTVVGRRDFQVKVRGQMVDLAEVEDALIALPDVAAAAVRASTTPRGDTRLTAFIEPRPGMQALAPRLRRALGSSLPAAAVPSAFAVLDSLPLTPQGKVDRQRLAQLEPSALEGSPDQAPVGETEILLAQIWARAFEVEDVGRDADFFELGGDSLTAAVIAAGVHAAVGVQMDLGAVVDSPTVVRMAAVVENLRSARDADQRPPLRRTSRAEPLPMSFAQERTWRTSQTPEASAGYTFAAGVRIRGPLDVAALRQSVDYTVRRHETLRTTFAEQSGEPIQVIHPAQPLDLPLIDLARAPDAEMQAADNVAREVRVPFDLRRGPLLRLRLLRTGPDDHQLWWMVHHIVADAWSWRLFFDEMNVLYSAFRRGEPPPLPADSLAFQYADFAAWERSWLDPSSSHYQAELAWWREALRDAPPELRLPFARATACPDAAPSDGVIRWGLPLEVSAGLDRLGREAAATPYMVRLAAFAVLLALETGQSEVVLGSYTTGRRLADTQAMFGFFSNMVTLRLRLGPELTFRDALARVRAHVIETAPHTEMPYGQLCDDLRREGIEPPPIRAIFSLGEEPPVKLADLEVTKLRRRVEAMPWEFSFAVDHAREASECGVSFDARIHDPAGVREFITRYQRLAADASAHPDESLAEVLAPG